MRRIAKGGLALLLVLGALPAAAPAPGEAPRWDLALAVPGARADDLVRLVADEAGVRLAFADDHAPADQGCLTQAPASLACSSGPHAALPRLIGIEGAAVNFFGGNLSTTAGDGYVRCLLVPPVSVFAGGAMIMGSCEKSLASRSPYHIEGRVEGAQPAGLLYHFALHED